MTLNFFFVVYAAKFIIMLIRSTVIRHGRCWNPGRSEKLFHLLWTVPGCPLVGSWGNTHLRSYSSQVLWSFWPQAHWDLILYPTVQGPKVVGSLWMCCFQKPNASSYFTSILKALANNSLLAVVRGTAFHLWSAKKSSKLFRFGFRVPNTRWQV